MNGGAGQGGGAGRFDWERWGPLIALAALFAVSALSSPYFLQPQNLLNVLRQVSYAGIIALGMTFVIVSGGIDLSVGSMVALVGGASLLAMNRLGGGPGAVAAAVAVALAGGVAAGAVNGLLVVRGRIAPFIATLGTMAVYRSLALYASGAGEFRSESALYPAIGMGRWLGVPVPVWVLFAMAGLFAAVLNLTPFGRHVRAVGSNERVARYAAIRVRTVRFACYLLSGFATGVATVLLSSRLNSVSSSNAGVNFELDAIAAAIIGGTSLAGGKGSMAGTLAGAVILGIVNNMLNLWGVSPYLQGTVKGAVILAAVLVQRRR
jgi:ribose transport system permease protein